MVGKSAYSIDLVKSYENIERKRVQGERFSRFHKSMDKWILTVQLDNAGIWFLSAFIELDGKLEKYSLDRETADDSHYEFCDEYSIRKIVSLPEESQSDFADILIRHLNQYGEKSLFDIIYPFVTKQYHF